MTPALTDEMVAGMDDMSEDHMREACAATPVTTGEGCYFSEQGALARAAALANGRCTS